jgi:hypothetical protein
MHYVLRFSCLAVLAFTVFSGCGEKEQASSGVSSRPMILAAATTLLGLIPLLADVFFVNMSITIMAGLGFATVLTLIVVPTLQAILFRIN